MLAQSDPWSPDSYFGQPAYIFPTLTGFFHSPSSEDQKVGNIDPPSPPPLGLGYFQLPQTPLFPQFSQISLPLVLGETIIDPFPVHFIQFTWVRLSHKHHTGSGWALPVCSWHSWCTIGTDTWRMFHPVTPGVAAWGCFLRSPFGATGPLGMYAVVSTLVLHLQLHWLTLEPLVEDGPVVQIIARWLLVIWLAALLAWGN